MRGIFTAMARIDYVLIEKHADEIVKDVLYACEQICTGAKCGDTPRLYDAVKTYIGSKPRTFKERDIMIKYYAANFLLDSPILPVKRLCLRIGDEMDLAIDYKRLNSYYIKIAEIVGTGKIDYFNDLLAQSFIVSRTVDIAAQALINAALKLLLTRDPETSKQLFQL